MQFSSTNQKNHIFYCYQGRTRCQLKNTWPWERGWLWPDVENASKWAFTSSGEREYFFHYFWAYKLPFDLLSMVRDIWRFIYRFLSFSISLKAILRVFLVCALFVSLGLHRILGSGKQFCFTEVWNWLSFYSSYIQPVDHYGLNIISVKLNFFPWSSNLTLRLF